ncbi:MAG TPA: ABC transporter substrate-binding protein, partial [Methylomirabilota bacterium]|nr:ABC transporter substrate-binding protein [Methylomirabilota bacterium]
LAAAGVARAQPPAKVWRVGLLANGAPPPGAPVPRALRDGLRDLGYVEGRNVAYVARWAEAKRDRLPGLAAELLAEKVDAIVLIGGPAALAAKQATSSTPLVLALVSEAVGIGVIDSLAHPGGNVTGVSDQAVNLSGKRMELLKEAVPKASRIAILWNADDQGMTLIYREVERAAQALRVVVQPLGVREPNDFDAAFTAMTASRPDALFMVTDALTNLNRKRVIEFADVHRIPAMYEYGELVHDGGLMSYGASRDDNFRKAAAYLDRLFKGARPAALPVERPSRYYLTINLKTARALGLVLPAALLARADEVVE